MRGSNRLLSLYHILHANIHAKHNHLRVHYRVQTDCVSLAWITPIFELYCVGALPSSTTNRGVSGTAEMKTAAIKTALAEAAQRVCQWVGREEQRLFIIGGAVRSGWIRRQFNQTSLLFPLLSTINRLHYCLSLSLSVSVSLSLSPILK